MHACNVTPQPNPLACDLGTSTSFVARLPLPPTTSALPQPKDYTENPLNRCERPQHQDFSILDAFFASYRSKVRKITITTVGQVGVLANTSLLDASKASLALYDRGYIQSSGSPWQRGILPFTCHPTEGNETTMKDAIKAHCAWYSTHTEAHNDAGCVTINHRSIAVDVPTINCPSSDGTNFG